MGELWLSLLPSGLGIAAIVIALVQDWWSKR